MYQDIIGLEELARIRRNELRNDLERFGHSQDLGILSLVAMVAGRVARFARSVETWATRPAPILNEIARAGRWHNS